VLRFVRVAPYEIQYAYKRSGRSSVARTLLGGFIERLESKPSFLLFVLIDVNPIVNLVGLDVQVLSPLEAFEVDRVIGERSMYALAINVGDR
jgi:hypothetical protein